MIRELRRRWRRLSHLDRMYVTVTILGVFFLRHATKTGDYPVADWGWVGWGILALGIHGGLFILWTLLRPETPGAK